MYTIKTELGKEEFLNSTKLEVGELAIVEYPSFFADDVVLMTYSGLVSLSHPQRTWSKDSPGILVKKLPRRSIVTLTL